MDARGATNMNSSSLPFLVWLASCLCLRMLATASPFDENGSTTWTSTMSSSRLLTVPILPHSAVTTRRRRRQLRERGRRRLVRSRRGVITSKTTTNSTGDEDDVIRVTATTAQLYEGYGTHYVDLWCGTPTPQRQTLIVDTGSAMTAFPCRFEEEEEERDGRLTSSRTFGCTLPKNGNCGADGVHHVGTLYDATHSATFATVSCPNCLRQSSCPAKLRQRRDAHRKPCLVEQWYREGSGWEAREARDLCYLGSFHNARKPSAPREDLSSPTMDGLDPSWASRFAFPLQFGCQTKVSGAFRTQLADGIMGMQPGVSSSLWEQVLAQSESRHSREDSNIFKGWETDGSRHSNQPDSQQSHWMKRGAFSLCFSSSPDIHNERLARRGLSAGLLTLGGADPRVSTETDMVYTKSGAPPGGKYFGVEIRHMYLVSAASDEGHQKSHVIRLDVSEYDLNRYQVIVDSGSTDTYLTSKAREPFERAWKQLVGSRLDTNKRFESLEALPTIVFQLKGVWGLNRPLLRQQRRSGRLSLLVGATNHPLGSTPVDPDHPHDVIIALPPSQYCEWDVRRRSCRLSIDFDSHEDSALGASTLLNYHVLFDADENRLGWARSSCNYTAIVGDEFPLDREATTHRFKREHDPSQVSVASDATKSVRFDYDEPPGARTADDNTTDAESDSNATNTFLPTPMASSASAAPAPDDNPLSYAVVRSWWVVSGLTLILLITLWRIRRRRVNGRNGAQYEDLAPLLRKE